MNDFVKIKADIDKKTTKKVNRILKKYRKTRDDLLKDIALKMLEKRDNNTFNFVLLDQNLTSRLNRLNKDQTEITEEILKESYAEAVKKTAKRIGNIADFNLLTDAMVKAAINYQTAGENFSTRIWSNTNRLANRITQGVRTEILKGTSPEKIARQIKKEFNVSAYQAKRLVNTETARIVNYAQIQVYQSSDAVKKLMYTATLESNTCSICANYDGKYFDKFSVPDIPVHPNCRCCYVPVIENYKPLMRVENNHKENDYIKYKTYDEWSQN